ncbi:GNAT family N-acetyltransferase [Celerinatantimonas yamalensis]|uniref:GNAT family protein n=1 Tax=Celerinatantimonas yamalensis TaxID=559956 RepID=A0ABW9G2W9_9GAMM
MRRDICIRPAQSTELHFVYQLVTENEEWTKFNGPYFAYTPPLLDDFATGTFERLCKGLDMQVITVDDVVVGSVNCYWECESTRWLEAGVVIYDTAYWGQGIAPVALTQWISHLFSTREIERVGMTTWSGNPRMMACASKLGFKQEARLRKVRFYQGEYYDSVKYGVLRSEWQQHD